MKSGKIFITFLVGVFIGVGIYAFYKSGDETRSADKKSLDKKVDEIVLTKEEFEKQKHKLMDKIDLEIARVSAKLEEVEKDLKKNEQEANEKLKVYVNTLKQHKNKLENNLLELEDASYEGWEKIKNDADSTFKQIGNKIEEIERKIENI